MTPRPRHPRPARRARAFTLAELIIAMILIALLGSAVYVALSQSVRARDRVEARAQALARARAAADAIALDAQNALRDSDLLACRVEILRAGRPGAGQDGLLLFAHLPRPVRPASGQAEGDEAEVQYRLEPADGDALALWRRVDPVVDEYPESGGVATALVPGLRALTLQAAGPDGAWLDDWDSDADGLPHALRITVSAADDSGREVATARRTVALDRVPVPSEVETDDAAAGATGTAGSAAGATTTPAPAQQGGR